MIRARTVGLALVAVFALSAAVAASASAATFIYKVPCHKVSAANTGLGEYNEEGCGTLGGTKEWTKTLLAGETKEVTSKIKPESEYVLKGEAFFVKSVTKCKKAELVAAEKPLIVGGKPGTSEKELVKFSECTATLGGAACKSVTVENTPTKNELVAIVKPEAKKGKLATLFVPPRTKAQEEKKEAGKFTTIKLTECGSFGSQEAEVTGTSAGLDSEGEKVAGTLTFAEGAEEITEVECAAVGGITKECAGTPPKLKVGLKFGGTVASLKGVSEVELVTKELWSVS